MNKIHLNNQISSYLYEQVSTYLELMINNGSLKPGGKLPSEKELCQLFDTSRITVRRAIKELHERGLLEVVHGKGTFVSKEPQKQTQAVELHNRRTDFSKDVQVHLAHATLRQSKPLEENYLDRQKTFEVIEVVRQAKDHLGLFGMEVIVLPSDLFPELKKSLQQKDLLETIEWLNALDRSVREKIEIFVEMSNEEISHEFNTALGSPILKMERIAFSQFSQPLVFSTSYFLGHRVRLKF